MEKKVSRTKAKMDAELQQLDVCAYTKIRVLHMSSVQKLAVLS